MAKIKIAWERWGKFLAESEGETFKCACGNPAIERDVLGVYRCPRCYEIYKNSVGDRFNSLCGE